MIFLTWPDDKTGVTVEVEFDVVTSDSYESVMEVTSHPVEKGAPVVDHAREQPKKLVLEGFVSNTPLPSNLTDEERIKMGFFPVALDYGSQKPQGAPLLTPGGLTKAVTSLLSPDAGLPKTATVFRAVGEMPDRARRVFEKLEAARIARALIKVSTRLHDVDNLLIEGLTVDRTVESAGGLPFQVSLVQVRIVESQFANLPKPSKPRAAKMVDKGSQQPQESLLYKGGSFAGLF